MKLIKIMIHKFKKLLKENVINPIQINKIIKVKVLLDNQRIIPKIVKIQQK